MKEFLRQVKERLRAHPFETKLGIVGLVFGSLAVANFMIAKREIEERLKRLPPEQVATWRDGTYQPPKPGEA